MEDALKVEEVVVVVEVVVYMGEEKYDGRMDRGAGGF